MSDTDSMNGPGTEKYILYLVVEDEVFAKNEKDGGPMYYNFVHWERENDNAGVDLLTAEDWSGANVHLLDLGVRAMLVNKTTGKPIHYWLLPRSSIYKTGYIMANSVGVIDSSYRGILKAPVVRVGGEGVAGFKRGDRHFQIVAPDMGWIEQVKRVSSLPATERGDGGFGSTGA